MRKFLSLFLITAFLLVLSPAAAQDSKGTKLRVVNLWAGDVSVDVYLDDALITESLYFGENAAYVALTAGTHAISVTAAGTTEPAITSLDIAVADGNNYTLVLAGEARAFVIDETTAFRSALLQTSSTVLILNATDTPLEIFYGAIATTLEADAISISDMPAASTLFSAFSAGATVIQEQIYGVPNNYAFIAITNDAATNTYALTRANFSSLTAADFMRGMGIGDANGLNLSLAAFENAHLLDELSGTAPLTIFAPTNAAIDAVSEDTLDAWLESRILLENVMGYHILQGEISLTELMNELEAGATPVLTTLQGTTPVFTQASDGTGLLIDSAHLVGAPYRVSNGVIYPIDTLLQPEVLPEVTVLP